MERASLISVKKDQHICLEGGECPNLALILEGTGRVYKLGETGKEITLYRVGEGESCILTASCILSERPFPAYAVCESDITAIIVTAGDVKQWLSEYKSWQDYIFGLIAHRLSNISVRVVDELVLGRMDARIAHYLLEATSHTTAVQTTHQIIASDLGTSREVVSRILKDLEQANLIQTSRGSISITDKPGLADKASAT